MFEIFQQDQGLVQRLKELKAYYKEKDEVKSLKSLKSLKEQELAKAKDSILRKVFKIYPGM